MLSNDDAKPPRSLEKRCFEEDVLVKISGGGNRVVSMSCGSKNTLLFIDMEMDR